LAIVAFWHALTRNDGYASGEAHTGHALERYCYDDEQGNRHHRKTRSSTKKFWQEKWEGGRWVKGAPEVKYLHKLRELLAAPPETTVWVTEGEKDANSITDLGLLAITGGATKFVSDFTSDQIERWFKGRHTVYVLEDNDPPGFRHAEIIAGALGVLVKELRIVQFRDLPPKSDVTDWLELGHAKDELIVRAGAAPLWQPPQLESLCIADAEMLPVEWLWPDRFAFGKLGLIVGLPEEGKGLLFCYVAARVTIGGL
jgi:hypothetical protein